MNKLKVKSRMWGGGGCVVDLLRSTFWTNKISLHSCNFYNQHNEVQFAFCVTVGEKLKIWVELNFWPLQV